MPNSLRLLSISTKKTITCYVTIIVITGRLFCLPEIVFAGIEGSDTALSRTLLVKVEAMRAIYPDSAMEYAKKALQIAEKSKSQQHISLAKQALGKCFASAENYETATKYFLEALKIEEQRQDMLRIADLSDDMGNIYYQQERFQLALDYYTRSYNLFISKSDSTGIARVLIHTGNLHKSRLFCESRTENERISDYKKAIEYYVKAEEIFLRTDNEEGLMVAYINLGNAYKRLNEFNMANEYLQKALEYCQQTNKPGHLIDIYFNLGLLYTLGKDYDKAIEFYNKSEAISERHNIKQGILYLYEEMAYTYDQAGKYKKARDYFVKYMIMRDSLFNLDKSKQIFELETRYQTEKKEKEILRLSLEKKRRNFFVSLLSLILIFTLITSWYFLTRSRHKRQLAEQMATINEQRIKELEQEKILVATQSVLSGEETERRRLARDLHDGLGGMLSGIKLKLTNMKGNFFLDEKGRSDFENALEMLDNSVNELRHVAHNLMPESLIKFGLKDALGDYCSTLDNSLDIKLRFSFYGNHKRIDQAIEIAMYRIAQELINNAIKHSGCTEIVIDLIQDPDRICLTVQDNGRGFDLLTDEAGKGMGLNSIKARVSALNGIIDMTTEKEKGTEIIIEFGIK